jgi:hypothetical protein
MSPETGKEDEAMNARSMQQQLRGDDRRPTLDQRFFPWHERVDAAGAES